MAKRQTTRREAARRVLDSISDYIEHTCPTSGDTYPAVPINKGHEVYKAVQELEQHFDGKLPIPARKHWAQLTLVSRDSSQDVREAIFAAEDLKDAINTIANPRAYPRSYYHKQGVKDGAIDNAIRRGAIHPIGDRRPYALPFDECKAIWPWLREEN